MTNYNELTHSEFICILAKEAHPPNGLSAENAELMDEAARRILSLQQTAKNLLSALKEEIERL